MSLAEGARPNLPVYPMQNAPGGMAARAGCDGRKPDHSLPWSDYFLIGAAAGAAGLATGAAALVAGTTAPFDAM